MMIDLERERPSLLIRPVRAQGDAPSMTQPSHSDPRPEPDHGPEPRVVPLIDAERIQRRVQELGAQISCDYRDRPLTIVAVLTGSLVLLADLIRQIHIPHRVGLLQASSYAGETTEAGPLQVNEAFVPDVRNRDVLLLDDILDTGQTIAKLLTILPEHGARSVRTAVMLRKRGRQQIPLEPDYVGFEIEDAFVVGYGLDYNDDYRHLPYVAILDLNP